MSITNLPLLGIAAPLNIGTMLVVLIAAVVIFAIFLRKRSNRHPMDTPEGKAAEEMRRKEAEEERREEGRPKVD
ncbi:hypothetical protein AAG612_06655 [Citromicrobium bathyomarinum]|uniref:hypothetical protein n=1 Tax=Citromicrobium bathyomarinum TaxID=72174 RepID=UPI00315B1322|tara:strand:+ start:707 stop:928 length:222 start_codon:yes stop_codon:yes gene_type:complete